MNKEFRRRAMRRIRPGRRYCRSGWGRRGMSRKAGTGCPKDNAQAGPRRRRDRRGMKPGGLRLLGGGSLVSGRMPRVERELTITKAFGGFHAFEGSLQGPVKVDGT